MRFSEAIRLGAMLRPQGFGGLFVLNFMVGGGENVASCALGAAAEASGAKVPDVRSVMLFGSDADALVMVERRWPFLRASGEIECPLGCKPSLSHARIADLGGMVAHLNDRHSWTREEIADYVAAFDGDAVDTRELVTC